MPKSKTKFPKKKIGKYPSRKKSLLKKGTPTKKIKRVIKRAVSAKKSILKKVRKNSPASRQASTRLAVKRVRQNRQTGKPSVKRKSKFNITENDILKLIEKGRQRGFVTESEIVSQFPAIEDDITGLERLYERLEAANINILDNSKAFSEESAKEFEEKKKIEKEIHDVGADSIQMYLREIGQYALLRAEEEVDLAKRIEKGDQAAREKLILSNLRLVVSIAKKYANRTSHLTLL